MKFGLMFFASSEESLIGDKYKLITESAKFGDTNDFSSIWIPERHFTKFGCLYPNPAVLQAALSTITQKIRLQAGSVVMALHNPLRVAEEWAMVDNLSGGRAGISFASGWNPDDFAFFPERYKDRHQFMYDNIEVVQELWKGNTIEATSGNGSKINVKVYPTPVQKELPVWITAAGSPQTFVKAGERGFHLLTHLLDQTVAQLQEKISLYRQARKDNGFDPDSGIVSIMLHTFVGKDGNLVREQTRKPYCEYLKANVSLLSGLAQSRGNSMDISKMSATDLDEFVNFLYERFATAKGLIGTPESCMELISQLDEAGVDEIACLLDFGPEEKLILDSLPFLNEMKNSYRPSKERLYIHNGENGANHQPKPVIESPIKQDFTNKNEKLQEEKADLINENGTLDFSPEKIKKRATEKLIGQEFYKTLHSRGIQLYQDFKGIENLWRGKSEALGEIRLPEETEVSTSYYKIHPALLDSCNQVLGAAIPDEVLNQDKEAPYLPVGLKNFEIFGKISRKVLSHAVLTPSDTSKSDVVEGNVSIYNHDHELIIRITGLRLQRVSPLNREMNKKLKDYFYEMKWEPKALPLQSIASAFETGKWLIFSNKHSVGEDIAQSLENIGHSGILIREGKSFSHEDKAYTINKESVEDFTRVIKAEGAEKINGIIHLWSLDTLSGENVPHHSLKNDQLLSCGSLLHLVHAVLGPELMTLPRIWTVTKGAQPVTTNEVKLSPVQSLPWGFGRVMSVEYPKLFGGLIDLGPESSPAEDARQVLSVISSGSNENQVAFRNNESYVIRLSRSELKLNPYPLKLSPNHTYFITGGLGNLGINMASWMVQSGARYIALAGRKDASAEILQRLSDIAANDTQIKIFKGDIADENDATRIFEEMSNTLPPLKGIIHAAGVTSYSPISTIDEKSLAEVLSPKVSGTWALHRLTATLDLAFFVNISSLSPLWGSKNLAHYAAANSFLDTFCHYRRSVGLPATTINLGPIGGGGMATELASLMTQSGLNLLNVSDAAKTLGYAIEADETQKIVADINWEIFKDLYESSVDHPLFEHIVLNKEDSRGDQESEFLKQLKQVPASGRESFVLNHLKALTGRVLGLKSYEHIGSKQHLFDLGLDSIIAIELKNQLQNDLMTSLRATLLFNYPTLDGLTTYILEEVLGPDYFKNFPGENADLNMEDDDVLFDIGDLDLVDEVELEEMILRKLEDLKI